MFILRIWQDVLEKSGIVGVLILAGYVALAVGAVLGLLLSIARAGVRWVRRWQLRRELRVLRGGRPAPLFTFYPELSDDQPPRPPIRSLRTRRGEDDHAA